MQKNGPKSMFAASNSNSTIRPRNRRLISINDDDENTDPYSNEPPAWPPPNVPSPFPSRGVSPIPQLHPSRSQNVSPELSNRRKANGNSTAVANRFESGNTSPKAVSSLWGSSWSSLQGLASSVLGNEPMQEYRKRQKSALRTPAWAKGSQLYSGGSATHDEWGPKSMSQPQLNSGSMEERRALVQAKKRETLLLANAHESTDSSGRYKRRDSGGRGTAAHSVEESEGDAYVYVHHVTPSDTIAGVTIKYGCQPETFRKVNRFWPNDSIQTRQTVLLPVDACAVRGRRIHEKSTTVNSDGRSDREPVRNLDPFKGKYASHTRRDSYSSDPSVSQDQEEPRTHSHWVQIENFADNVSVARIPRRALGFFPPTRRKSVSFSDTTSQSPSTSLDLGSRLDPPPSSLTSSPRGSRYSRSSRNRSSSGSYFASRLHGPGGVGTLRGANAVSPGPAQDSLNRVLGPHLPNLAPRSSFESIHSETSRVSSSTGLENFGGAIEGWVRKMASKAAGWAEGTHQGTTDMGKPSGGHWVGAGWGGDLIELGTPFEIGEDEDDRPPAGGGAGNDVLDTPRAGRFEERRTIDTGRGSSSADHDEFSRDRFQSRGRSRNTSFGKSKDD